MRQKGCNRRRCSETVRLRSLFQPNSMNFLRQKLLNLWHLINLTLNEFPSSFSIFMTDAVSDFSLHTVCSSPLNRFITYIIWITVIYFVPASTFSPKVKRLRLLSYKMSSTLWWNGQNEWKCCDMEIQRHYFERRTNQRFTISRPPVIFIYCAIEDSSYAIVKPNVLETVPNSVVSFSSST